MTTIILLITSLAAAQEQQETFIDFDGIEITGEMIKPNGTIIFEVPRPKADMLILDIRQEVLDKQIRDGVIKPAQQK